MHNDRRLILYLATLAAVPSLSTDMYLPALGGIATQWGVPESMVNLSLVFWFIAFAGSLLVAGSLSDRFGRKPVLIVGLGLFITASLLCAMSGNVQQLIACRILQGIGASAPSAMAMAICRDRFEGVRRRHALAWVGVILGVMPMLGPSIGSILLAVSRWPSIFIVQAALAGVALLLTIGYRESVGELIPRSIVGMIARYIRLARNRRFVATCGVMNLICGPFFGFIAFSPFVYMTLYQCTPAEFSLLFALNAIATMSGSFVCTLLLQRWSDRRILTLSFTGCLLAGLAVMLFGRSHLLAFAGAMTLYAFSFGVTRPLNNHLALEQVEEDIGAASSVLVFYQFLIGASCMWLVRLDWQQPILTFGLLATVLPSIVLIAWPMIARRIT